MNSISSIRSCYALNWVPPKKIDLNPNPSISECDLIWKRQLQTQLVDFILVQAGPLILYDWCVYKKRGDTHKEDSHVMMEAEREMTHLYKPRITSKYQELEEAKKGIHRFLKGMALPIPSFQTSGLHHCERNLCFKPSTCVVICYGSLREITQMCQGTSCVFCYRRESEQMGRRVLSVLQEQFQNLPS